jgi:citrate lyase subunit beta/citryl-CoA lyase
MLLAQTFLGSERPYQPTSVPGGRLHRPPESLSVVVRITYRRQCTAIAQLRTREGGMPVLRSMLFAPGNHARRVEKALSGDADAVILDLEDACPVSEKAATRPRVVEALRRPRTTLGYVRINALSTEYAYGDLLAVVQAGVDGIMLPKVERAHQLRTADWLITQLERERGLRPGCIDLLPLIETGKGFAALEEITRACSRVRRLAFGAGDLTTDLGITWTTGELELVKFRSDLILASRAADLEPPIDLAWIVLNEPKGLQQSIEWGRVLGFQGKLCIHPDHVGAINAAFTPSEAQLANARRIVAAFEDAEQRGSAAINVDGMMIDYPIVHQARRLLDAAQRIRTPTTRS